MANFPKNIATGGEGTRKAKSSSKGGGIFQKMFFWKAGEHRFVQFISEYTDIPALPMHTVKGAKYMQNFVSPRAWHGPDADDALEDAGWAPAMKQVAVAVEVLPIMGTKNGRSVPVGWEPKINEFDRKDGSHVEEPTVGVIINTPTLFTHIDNYFEDNGTIKDTVFKITRNGGDQNTSYTVTPAKGDPIELTADIVDKIDLAEWLESLADSEAIRELVESLPENHEYNFSKRNKPTVKVVPEDQDEELGFGDVEEEDEPVDAAALKQSKFDQMKAQMS